MMDGHITLLLGFRARMKLLIFEVRNFEWALDQPLIRQRKRERESELKQMFEFSSNDATVISYHTFL